VTQHLAEPIARLIDEFNRLPGIGPKSAQRLTFYLLRVPKEQALSLAEAIQQVKERIATCSVCFNLSEQDPCAICQDPQRDRERLCVVEEPLDILALERAGYKGLYHVLHGVLNPVEGIGPDDLRIAELLKRLRDDPPAEVILATNTSMEGEATAMYLSAEIKRMGIYVTRIARGLPIGGDLEYADEMTLAQAMDGRRAV
jgi:recombination protein RecR